MRRSLPPLQAPATLYLGDRVIVRTIFGRRVLRLRLVGRSRSGRGFLIGHGPSNLCHRAWLQDVIHVETANRKRKGSR